MTGYCCTPDSGDCCGPGSWCCGKAGKHDHEETRMTTNHIDQMRAWWDEATPGIPKTGDTYIEDERHRGSSFRIVEAATDHKYGFENIRILDRAPAPKPAWHDAGAVIAHTDGLDSRRLFRSTAHGWRDLGATYAPGDLRDVIPLIEQKATKEARDRLWKTIRDIDWDGGVQRSECKDEIDALLHAALGLDPA